MQSAGARAATPGKKQHGESGVSPGPEDYCASLDPWDLLSLQLLERVNGRRSLRYPERFRHAVAPCTHAQSLQGQLAGY